MEDCQVITVSTIWGNSVASAFTFEHTRGGRGDQRTWFAAPRAGRMFKLYRPPHSSLLACRHCHDLTYPCVQGLDARLNWLVKARIEPEWS